VALFHAKRGLARLVELARRGHAAEPVEPRRRRLILLQIDGLSSRRLRDALARGEMPHLRRRLDSGEATLCALTAATPPSTPVFQAGLLYGAHGEVPGFGWYDRALGRTVRMDLPDDVLAVEEEIRASTRARPLLERGVSYGTIWPAGAPEAFFNVVRFVYGRDGGATASGRVVFNSWDRILSTVAGAAIAGRLVSRFLLELGVGAVDFLRWCTRLRTTRFEWRFLYMRLFVSVIMRDVSTQGALLDVLRGVPVIYVDYLGYDEYAHRRGPDAEMALFNLRGVDHCIERIRRAANAVPEYGYQLYVFSDHGHSATVPFERVTGQTLAGFVLSHAASEGVARVDAADVRELVALREAEFWLRTLWRPLRTPWRAYVWWLKRRMSWRMRAQDRAPLDAIEVVTGGSVAHLYFDRARPRPLAVEEIERRWPRLLRALTHHAAIGLVLARSADGPVVWHRGRRHSLAALPIADAVIARQLAHAAASARSGDLVLYGAFAELGNIAFDFEFGSHGGLHPDELDQFVVHPSAIEFPLAGAVEPEDFHSFFRRCVSAW
jgi:hypothetical protein